METDTFNETLCEEELKQLWKRLTHSHRMIDIADTFNKILHEENLKQLHKVCIRRKLASLKSIQEKFTFKIKNIEKEYNELFDVINQGLMTILSDLTIENKINIIQHLVPLHYTSSYPYDCPALMKRWYKNTAFKNSAFKSVCSFDELKEYDLNDETSRKQFLIKSSEGHLTKAEFLENIYHICPEGLDKPGTKCQKGDLLLRFIHLYTSE